MVRSPSLVLRRMARLAGLCAALAAPVVTRGAVPGPLPPSNLERIETCAAAIADSLLEALPAHDSLCVAIVPHDAAWIVERAIVENASRRSVDIRRCDAGGSPRLDVAITAVGVVYTMTDDDAIERTARMGITAIVPSPLSESGASAAMRTLRFEHVTVDTLARADTAGAADPAYAYTRGVATPADSGGFWQKIVEPAVVLAASAIVAILLFTVRSQ